MSYLKPYYEEQFQKIEQSNEAYKGKWNWCAFLFSWIWGLTKGLWGLAILTIVIDSISSRLTYGAIPLIIAIIWGVRGNYCYYNLNKYNKQFPNKL